MKLVHFQTGPGAVACKALIPEDFGTASTDISLMTCPACEATLLGIGARAVEAMGDPSRPITEWFNDEMRRWGRGE